MSEKTPGRAAIQSTDLPAIAAYGASIDETDGLRVLDAWSRLSESGRAEWRAIADAVRMALDLETSAFRDQAP